MRSAERLRRVARRADTRAVFAVGATLVLALGVQASLLWAFSAEEALEQADHWLEQAHQLVRSLDAQQVPDEALLRAAHAALPGGMAAARFAGPDGATQQIGEWPRERRQTPARGDEAPNRGVLSFLLLRADDFLVETIALRDGRRLELAMPLKRFAGEARELAILLGALVLLSSIAAFGVAILATRRAFAPLQEGTALLAAIDAAHLGSRLPTRDTGDPVDRHAETLNAVLAGIEAAFARLRSFAGDVAHELRTPLNRIRNTADVALARGDAASLAAALERIQGSTDELGRMVEALLLIAELDDRRVPLAIERVDVDAWLRRSLESWAPACEEHGVRLALEGEAGKVDTDPALLDRVLSNLLDNAIRHGAAGGRALLRCERDEDGVVLSLDDAGPGIPPAERERVFERFVRLDRSQRGSAGGLGLALARSVARGLGGELSVEASPLGGARFVWRLPHRSSARASSPT